MDSIGKLAAIAYPPGECTGSPEARKNLWKAFFNIPEWSFVVHPSRETDPYPFLDFIQERSFVYLFTSSGEARSFAEQKNMFSKEGHALILQMDQDRCLEWLEELYEQGVHGIYINAAGNAWQASLKLLLTSYRDL